MFRLTIKELAAKKLRLLTTGLAVLLGVAFLAGTLVLTDTVGRTIDSAVADANAGTDAYVRGHSALSVGYGESRPRIAADLADDVARTPGVAEVAVRTSGYAQLVGPDGKPVGDPDNSPVFGLTWTDVDALNPYRIAEGRAPRSDDEIAIDRNSADIAGYEPGDVATVLTKTAPRRFTIAGVVRFGTADSPAGAAVVLFTPATAPQLLGEPGKVDGIAVTAAPGTSDTELAQRLQATVGDDVEVLTGTQLTAEEQSAIAEDLSFFNTFMLMFALVAVFVAAFIINNTFSITVAQRTRETAMLRTIGASRRQVLRAVLAEAVLVGTLASAAGLAAGIGVASGLQALLETFGFDVPPGGSIVTTRTVVASLAVGIVVTIVSALLPARRAAKVKPVEAMRQTAVDRAAGSRRGIVAGSLVSAAGVALLLTGLAGGTPATVGLGAAVVFVGVAVLGPVFARPVARIVGAPLRLRGVSGKLARENAMRNPQRTARTAASLMIGVGLVGFISIFAASTKESIAGSIDRDYRGTHIIDAGAFGTAGISPELTSTLRRTPGVQAVSATRTTRAEVNGVAAPEFYAFDASTIGKLFDLGHVEGDLSRLGADGIAVAADHAENKGWHIGDTVQVTFTSGTRPFTVRATYEDATWTGKQFVGLDAFEASLPDQLDTRIYVKAADDAAVDAATSAYPWVDVMDKDEAVDVISADIDQMLGLIYVLLALAVVIALLGIANTLALSIFERTRELGLLRAVGMTKAQVRSAVRWEAVIIALFGTLLGLAVGGFFGWAMVQAMADYGIDTLAVPATTLAAVAGIAAVAGVAAAILPARRAARLHVLEAIATA